VRRLLRVADREDHGVHADDGETVLRWRGHAASMRTGHSNCATIEYWSISLVILSIYSERMRLAKMTLP
jgi:hypothetical protein